MGTLSDRACTVRLQLNGYLNEATWIAGGRASQAEELTRTKALGRVCETLGQHD